MARPIKQGIPYYSIDTDVFSNRKIRRVLKNFGANGYLVYSYVLTEIYRDKGYFIVWDENTVFDVSDYLNLKETLVSEVIGYCCNVGLFNKELLTSGGILTSKSIQEFWLIVVKKANRIIKEINPKYNILEVKKEESAEINEESTPNNEETPKNSEESTQSKVKESKVNKTTPKGLGDYSIFFESVLKFFSIVSENHQRNVFSYLMKLKNKNQIDEFVNQTNAMMKWKTKNPDEKRSIWKNYVYDFDSGSSTDWVGKINPSKAPYKPKQKTRYA